MRLTWLVASDSFSSFLVELTHTCFLVRPKDTGWTRLEIRINVRLDRPLLLPLLTHTFHLLLFLVSSFLLSLSPLLVRLPASSFSSSTGSLSSKSNERRWSSHSLRLQPEFDPLRSSSDASHRPRWTKAGRQDPRSQPNLPPSASSIANALGGYRSRRCRRECWEVVKLRRVAVFPFSRSLLLGTLLSHLRSWIDLYTPAIYPFLYLNHLSVVCSCPGIREPAI